MLTSRWGEGPVWLKNRPERNYNKRVSGVKVWEAKALVHQPVVLQPHHLNFALGNQLPALSPSNRCKSKKNSFAQVLFLPAFFSTTNPDPASQPPWNISIPIYHGRPVIRKLCQHLQMYIMLGFSHEEEWQKQKYPSLVAPKHGYCHINALLFLNQKVHQKSIETAHRMFTPTYAQVT